MNGARERELCARIRKLEAALTKIADLPYATEESAVEWKGLACAQHEIARAALEDEPG
jgi:hypothetical protein